MADFVNNYDTVLDSLKEKIRLAKLRAITVVNTELLTIYWEIGNTILHQQQKEGWGARVIQRLSVDLKTTFPDFRGLSVRNLQYMKSFAEAWPVQPIVQPSIAQLQMTENQLIKFVQPLVAQLPWAHHIVILNKLTNSENRLFYIQKAIENGWSKSILAAQIDTGLHLRQGNAITNFDKAIGLEQSDLAKETFKNPYIFDFLGMGEQILERELENALIQHMKNFMLELGRGFAFVGNQYNLQVEGDDYFFDLLFFNYKLNCFVVFELKVGDFKPEFTGKLNFYINTIDEQIKQKEHKSTIGILLCKTPNNSVVKFALKGVATPMGVAEYELTNAIPKQLRTEMPTIEELEQELGKKILVPEKPIEAKRKKLYEILDKIKGEELTVKKNNEIVFKLFEEALARLMLEVEKLLLNEMQLFSKSVIWRSINGHANTGLTRIDIETKTRKENIYEIGIYLGMDGFKKAGTQAFNISETLIFYLHDYKYQIGPSQNRYWKEKLYHEEWTEEEIKSIAEQWSMEIIDKIKEVLERMVI
ncbi:MAG: PDDEXK nuclease domain-containing protein [Chitinophagaceae bacterium]|nr:PDDEXK nuclease domain-containing protein [Chitinophagaceae bacterium]